MTQEKRDAAAILERLDRDLPELADRVRSGELTANAAAVKAGFRQQYARVRLDDPVLAIRVLVRHYPVHVLRDAVAEVMRRV